MREEADLLAGRGFVEPALHEEFPGLELAWISLIRDPRRRSASLRRRLAEASARYRGASVIAMRTQPIPHAHRTFFRQIGLDPDVSRIPSEAAALARLMHGGFRSEDPLSDAQTLAVIETGVGVWALDGAVVEAGGLGIRLSLEGERLGSGPHERPLSPGRMVIADARQIHALLFGELAEASTAHGACPHVVLFAVGVPGVPAIHLEEALWVAAEALADAE